MVIVVASLALTGVVFLVVALLIRGMHSAQRSREQQTVGELVGFRHVVYEPGPDAAAYDAPEYEDIGENIPTSYPLVRLSVGGQQVVAAAEYPNDRLTGEDIGARLELRYEQTGSQGQSGLRVYLDDELSRRQRHQTQSRLFWIFAGTAAALFIAAAVLCGKLLGKQQ